MITLIEPCYKRAQINDLAALHDCWIKAKDRTEWTPLLPPACNFIDFYRALIKEKKVWIAQEGTQILGFISFEFLDTHLMIQSLGVSSFCRQENIGQTLLNVVLTHGYWSHCEQCITLSRYISPSASLLRKNDFLPISEQNMSANMKGRLIQVMKAPLPNERYVFFQKAF